MNASAYSITNVERKATNKDGVWNLALSKKAEEVTDSYLHTAVLASKARTTTSRNDHRM